MKGIMRNLVVVKLAIMFFVCGIAGVFTSTSASAAELEPEMQVVQADDMIMGDDFFVTFDVPAPDMTSDLVIEADSDTQLTYVKSSGGFDIFFRRGCCGKRGWAK